MDVNNLLSLFAFFHCHCYHYYYYYHYHHYYYHHYKYQYYYFHHFFFIANFANADYCTFSNDEILDSCFLDKCQKTTSSLGLSKVQIILEKYRSRSFTKRTPFSCKIIQILGCSSSDDSVNSDCTGGTIKVVVGSC